MFRCLVRRTAFVLAGSAVVVNSVDSNNEGIQGKKWSEFLPSFFSKTESSDVIDTDKKENLTGLDRLYIMFTKNEFGHPSKELNTIFYCTYTSFFVGSMYGVMSKTKQAHDEFIAKNQATQFANIYEARRALQDKVMIAGFKGLFYQGGRLAFFTGGILTIIMSLMVYFNSTSVFHYGIAAGTCGAIHRWKFGPKGMFAGGVVGGVLGIIAGCMTKGVFFLWGVNMDDVVSYQDSIMLNRDKSWKEIQEKSSEEKRKYSSLLKEHDEFTKETSSTSVNEKKEEKHKNV